VIRSFILPTICVPARIGIALCLDRSLINGINVSGLVSWLRLVNSSVIFKNFLRQFPFLFRCHLREHLTDLGLLLGFLGGGHATA